jgi:hypothetical protein
MPHANIWIREDDWELWTAIEKKSEFISEALNSGTNNGTEPIEKPITKQINNVIDKVKKVADANEIKLCKHHSALGLCKYGCK